MDAAAKSALAPVDDPVVADGAGPLPRAAEDPWNKVRALALKQLDRFMALEPKVLKGDNADAIHDLRVASRRLQQILDLLHPHPHGEIRKLRRKIRRSRRVLGNVRNADVQLARVKKILARKRTARRQAWQALHDYLSQQRSESFARAIHKLSRLNLAVFYVRLKLALGQNGQAFEAADVAQAVTPPSSSREFEDRLTNSFAGVWQAFEARVGESHRDSNSAVIHSVRIAAKRLRYLVEVLDDFRVAGTVETLSWLRGVQELLGQWHDLEVLEQMMLAMVARPEFLRDNLGVAMEVEKLVLKCRTDKRKFREQYFRQTLEGEEFQRVRSWAEGAELKAED